MVNVKNIATVVLLTFVGASAVYLVIQESTSRTTVLSDSEQIEGTDPESKGIGESEPKSAEPGQPNGHQLIAYYFHRTLRCRTCLTIEAYAEEALRDAFPDALKTGALAWRPVNLEEPGNEHFVEDYQLTSSTLVLVDTDDGEQQEWRNLDRVWELVGDELEFKAYVEAEALRFLGQGS